MNSSISTEMLNAYIDNEFDDKETRDIEAQIKQSSTLQKQLQDLQQTKLRIQASYASVRPPVRQHKPVKSMWLPTATAASLTLLVGITSGWFGHQFVGAGANKITSAEKLLGVKLEALKPQDNKIIIHLAQNDQLMFDKALAKAEALLQRFESLEQNGSIELLANSTGMDLLRKDKSPYRQRIVNLMQHDNIKFIACPNTIQRLESNGDQVQLINGVKVHGPVINEIVTRMQDGWTYIKI